MGRRAWVEHEATAANRPPPASPKKTAASGVSRGRYPNMDLGQVLHLQLFVAIRRVNYDTVSIAMIGRASERLIAVRSPVEMDTYNTIMMITAVAAAVGVIEKTKTSP